MTNPNNPQKEQQDFLLMLSMMIFIYGIYFIGWIVGFANGKLF